MWFSLLLLWWSVTVLTGNTTSNVFAVPNRPSVLNIGAIFTVDSIIGNGVKTAIELAVEDVNANVRILNATRLNLIVQNTDCNGFYGYMQALQLMEKNKEVVAILGPQSSGIAHVISHVVNELQIPLLSFAATDPSLTSLQHPYFIRATQNDYFQMHAVASLIEYYKWRDVVSIFVDDDYGRGGVSVLSDALSKKRSKISHKALLPEKADMATIRGLLSEINLMESRVFVVHVNPDSGLQIFKVAKQMGMMADGYVWIATDWLASRLDSSDLINKTVVQGVICLRQYTPDSALKSRFMSKWKNNSTSSPNSYAFNAYDSVWIIAHAIDKLLNDDGVNISFSPDPNLRNSENGSLLDFSALYKFDGGDQLLRRILGSNFVGLTGSIQFDSNRNLVNPSYRILNVVKNRMKSIGFWTDRSGLSVIPLHTSSAGPPKLADVIWPGKSNVKPTPRGWAFPGNNTKTLRIGVPYKASFTQFVSNGSDGIGGYCIDVFKAAVDLLPYDVKYELQLFGDGLKNPSYKQLVMSVENNTYDAAVGDVTIVTNRTVALDFTQPYMESGLVIVIPIKTKNSNAWSFLEPFTVEMWLVTVSFFLFVGVVVWILEHRSNTEFRGSPREQAITICWFTFSTMFYAHRETMQSTLARFVLIIWLFVILIITSSYTANLTSILTIQQLATEEIHDIYTLLSSPKPIGFQTGSFTHRYMIENLNVAEERLVALTGPEDYKQALDQKRVAAIVDERPFIELFLSTNCNYKIVGIEFTKSGWGFGFQKNSPLTEDITTAILTLSGNGQLRRIHNKWLKLDNNCPSLSDDSYYRLSLDSFWGLFVICGFTCFVTLTIFFTRLFCQYRRFTKTEQSTHNSGVGTTDQLQTLPPYTKAKSFKKLLSFVDKKEADIINSSIKTTPTTHISSGMQLSPGASSSSPLSDTVVLTGRNSPDRQDRIN